MIEQNNANISPIVLIDYSSSNVDKVLGSQSGTGSHPTIATSRNFDLNIGENDLLAMCGNCVVVGTVQIIKTIQLGNECEC